MSKEDEEYDNVLDISYVYEDTQIEKASEELSTWIQLKIDEGISVMRLLGVLEFAKITMMMDNTYDFEEEE